MTKPLKNEMQQANRNPALLKKFIVLSPGQKISSNLVLL
jgi:hypothetical protein